MWFFSAEAWSLFFRVGYLCFVALCTVGAFLFIAHLLIEAAFRLTGKYYGWQALLEASRELQRQGKAPKFRRFINWTDKHPT